MKIEDMANWTVDQLKKEVVRLSEECEKRQHEILDKNEKINKLYTELDKVYGYNNELKEQITELKSISDLKDDFKEIPFDKDELKHLFIGEKEMDTSGIPEFPGDLINYSLQSVGKEFEFRTEFKLPKEIFYSLFFSKPDKQK